MSQHPHPMRLALVAALTLALAACGKPETQVGPAASSPAVAAEPGSKPTTMADCDKLPDPRPVDESAAGRAAAVSDGLALRAACKKEASLRVDGPAADLARIREIKEKEQADLADRNLSEKEWSKRIKEGGNKPVREFKY